MKRWIVNQKLTRFRVDKPLVNVLTEEPCVGELRDSAFVHVLVLERGGARRRRVTDCVCRIVKGSPDDAVEGRAPYPLEPGS